MQQGENCVQSVVKDSSLQSINLYNMALTSFNCLVRIFQHNVCYYHRYFLTVFQSKDKVLDEQQHTVHLINLGYIMLKVKYAAIKSSQ